MTKCPTCCDNFDSLGTHFRWNESCVKEIEKYEKDILFGILLSDGWIGTSGKVIQGEWACEEYVKYIEKELGWIVSDVTKRSDRDIWQLCTISLEEIKEIGDKFYEDNKKRFPLDVEITNTIMRHWYAGDGHLRVRDSRKDIMILSCYNEKDRIEKVCNWVEECGFSRPNVHESKRSVNLYFSTKNTKKILTNMDAIPGYEYKWGEYND